MESTLLAASATKYALSPSKSVNSSSCSFTFHFQRHSSAPPLSHIVLPCRLARARLGSFRPGEVGDLSRFGSISLTNSLVSLYLQPVRKELRSVSGSAASSARGGGGNDGVSGQGSGGGGGDGAGEGDKQNPSVSAAAGDDVSALFCDVIILHVGGMTCGGCAASVKRILESQPQVSSATVNLATETAIIWPVSEAKAVADWQKQLGEELAKHLTNCGFKSNFQGQGAYTERQIPS